MRRISVCLALRWQRVASSQPMATGHPARELVVRGQPCSGPVHEPATRPFTARGASAVLA
jgi:hypothetical protein